MQGNEGEKKMGVEKKIGKDPDTETHTGFRTSCVVRKNKNQDAALRAC
jgi:hypothetical protein